MFTYEGISTTFRRRATAGGTTRTPPARSCGALWSANFSGTLS